MEVSVVKVRYVGPLEEIALLGFSVAYRMKRGEPTLVLEEDANRLLEDPAFELVDDEVFDKFHEEVD